MLTESYTSWTAEHVLEWGGLSRPALSILWGVRGMLPRENVKIWVPEWLKMQCGPCTCSHVTATRIKGLMTGTFLLAQSDFAVETGENTEFAVGSFLMSFAVGNSQQRVVACRHFVASCRCFKAVSLVGIYPFQGPVTRDDYLIVAQLSWFIFSRPQPSTVSWSIIGGHTWPVNVVFDAVQGRYTSTQKGDRAVCVNVTTK